MPDQNNILAKGIGKNFNRTILGTAPLIVFIGPARCGKSMVLMSLVEYLRANEGSYTVSPNLEYIPNDSQYEQKCEHFMETLEENAVSPNGWKDPLDGTVDEILLDIREGGENGPTKFRMLEAPGEDFFSLNNPNKDYADYLKAIITKTRKGNYPVYYVMLLDLYTDNNKFNDINDSTRTKYESRLIKFFQEGYDASRGDKVILLYNKIDLVKGSRDQAMKSILDDYYPSLRKHLKKPFFVFFSVPVFDGVLPYKSGNWKAVQDDEGNSGFVYETDKESERFAKTLWEKLTSRF